MRRLAIPALLLLLACSGVIALELPADGDWFCEVGGDDLGALAIAGDTYAVTNAADIEAAGNLAISFEGTKYEVTSGALRDIFRVTGFSYDGADRLELALLYADGSTATGECRRT